MLLALGDEGDAFFLHGIPKASKLERRVKRRKKFYRI